MVASPRWLQAGVAGHGAASLHSAPEKLVLPDGAAASRSASRGPASGRGGSEASSGCGEAWTDYEQLTYIVSTGIVRLPEEERALGFLFEALRRSLLPKPWQLLRDSADRVYFADPIAGVSSWTHPLEPSLRELANVFRLCADTPADLRDLAVASLLATWEEEATREMEPWQHEVDPDGARVFRHRDTSEVLRVSPLDALLPRLFIKIQALERLKRDNYTVDTRYVLHIISSEGRSRGACLPSGGTTSTAVSSEGRSRGACLPPGGTTSTLSLVEEPPPPPPRTEPCSPVSPGATERQHRSPHQTRQAAFIS